MVRWFACAALMGVLALCVRAGDDKKDDKKKDDKKGADALQALQKEYIPKLQEETDAEKRQEILDELGGKLVDHAKAYPKDGSGLQALGMALAVSGPKSKARGQAKDVFAKDYAKGKLNFPFLQMLAGDGTNAETLALAKSVYKDNPDKMTRALAAKALVGGYEQQARVASIVEKNKQAREFVEKKLGKEGLEKFLEEAKGADKQVAEFRRALKEDFKGVLPDLSVGANAPETKGVTLEGKDTKLSDHKGKVVVLDFWATWCPPCKAMIPHSRGVVKKMAGKPFVLISISADEKKSTLEEFVKDTPMPWTHWWDGGGKLVEQYEVSAFPTLYVIDHKGVIRHTQRGFGNPEAFDEIVEKLVKEAAGEDKKKD